MRFSHSSSTSFGRALSAGKEPTMPALHCSITRSGLDTMNSGAPTTGIERLSRSRAGSAIIPLHERKVRWVGPDLARTGPGRRLFRDLVGAAFVDGSLVGRPCPDPVDESLELRQSREQRRARRGGPGAH